MPYEKMLAEIDLCNECGACEEVCPIYKVNNNDLFTPLARLQIAKKVFLNIELTDEEKESIYNCPKCYLCSKVCPQGIDIPGIIHEARVCLAKKGAGPLEKHKKIISGLQNLGNAVNGDPAKRLEWLPEPFPEKESDTLFFVGCLPSYVVTECARSSYFLLKKLNVDFMLLKDEGCCGVYLYDSGRTDLAKELFAKNIERFANLGIKRLIVACAGCYRCFKRYYPQLLGDMDIEVVHITELLAELLKGKEKVLDEKLEVVYQDPCRLGRMENLYQEPRQVLQALGVTVQEMPKNREEALCCGAGSGLRSVFPDLSLKLAGELLDSAPVDSLVTSCPFCAFQLSYAARKLKKDRNIIYIATLLNSLL